jgi:putative flavoprotein involved in K+ transport
VLECVVIGAGQAGLSASCHLSRHGIEHVVLERGRVGETWRTRRWDSFCLNTPNWCTRLPGMDPPGEPDVFASREDVVAMFTDYASRIEAPVQRAEVTSLRATPEGGFELTIADDVLATRSVVVATGAFQQPTGVPASADLPRGVVHMHTAEYRNPGELPDGGVLIVGSGQSGCEIGMELLEAGRPVHLAVGRCGWFPRRYRGREVMRWLVDVGAMDEGPDVLASPVARVGGNFAVSGSRGGRDCNALVLEQNGALLYGRFAALESGRAVFADNLDENLDFGRTFERTLAGRCDKWAEAEGLDLPPAMPEAARPARTHDATELELDREGVTTMLWAGGFRPAFSWIDLSIFDELGFPRARRGVTDVPGLVFVGLPWLHTRKSPLLLGVGGDAEHVAHAIATHLESTA